MLDGTHGTSDPGGAARMRAGLAEHNWMRLFYLTNMVGTLIVSGVYFLNLNLEISRNPELHRPLTVLVLYLAAFVGWFLVEGFGALDGDRDAFLSGLYGALGLRWLDAVMLVGAVLALLVGWRLHFLTIPLGIIAGLTIVNGVIGLLTHQARYEVGMMEAAAAEPAVEQMPQPSPTTEQTA